ncbi:NUDIX hydrolase [Williamsia sterculiae]|uniref:Nudix hydrolase domain-containing protein n=1 Tax=Williamsia sterculiae TaxID=1344003 RepID=A0A1N7G353_9NOCA|nr:NUDIX hydrolase [Williamsia sterculiae]SIS07002.1 hypothetical protein SAMN05445060_2445 [Williamsia sterculiae]
MTTPVRDAATVVLIRDGEQFGRAGTGVEVFLMRRVRQMAFAGGMTVFPGGGVDPTDARPTHGTVALPWTGPDPDEWASSLGADVATTQALVCAAVRETFEECGVLLATDSSGTFPDVGALQADRRALEAKTLSVATFLRDRGLTLRADLIRPLAHWITPEAESRRYDTRFFLAALPEGQNADGETTEAAETGWSTPRAALDAWAAGRHHLLPPTWAQLRYLDGFRTVADAMAAESVIEPIQPTIVSDGTHTRIVFDGDADYLGARTGVQLP